jgi:hypothetical protein
VAVVEQVILALEHKGLAGMVALAAAVLIFPQVVLVLLDKVLLEVLVKINPVVVAVRVVLV